MVELPMSKYVKRIRAKNLTEEHKKSISLSLKKWYSTNKRSEETRQRISLSKMGHIGANLGKKFSEETKRKMSEAQKGEKNPNWKKHDINYSTVHHWLYREYGKANHCDNGHISKTYDWANKSGKYLRDITDWGQLCRSCNMKDGISMKLD